MAILAVITKPEEIKLVIPWAAEFATVRKTPLTVMCWVYSPLVDQVIDSSDTEELIDAVQRFVNAAEDSGSLFQLAESKNIDVSSVFQPDASLAAVNFARSEDGRAANRFSNASVARNSSRNRLWKLSE